MAKPGARHPAPALAAAVVAVLVASACAASETSFSQHPGFATYFAANPRSDVAIRSNELYPRVPGRLRRRAVSFLRAETARYLVTGEGRPVLAFAGFLGERRRLAGRDGPPGADFNTLPAFKPKGIQLVAFYWRDGDPGDAARVEAALRERRGGPGLAAAQAGAFYQDWQATRPGAPAPAGGPS